MDKQTGRNVHAKKAVIRRYAKPVSKITYQLKVVLLKRQVLAKMSGK
jgi:hypothetical protein